MMTVKWSTESGHRVKAVKCHNEVNDDNRKETAKQLHGRRQRLYPKKKKYRPAASPNRATANSKMIFSARICLGTPNVNYVA